MAITLAQLRALAAIADAGSFSGAAVELGVTQSAVSHAIGALEQELDELLLHRHPVLTLTGFGLQVLDHARRATGAADAVQAATAARRRTPQGSIRLAAPPTVCHSIVPELLKRWSTAFPLVEVSLFEGEDEEVAAWVSAGMAELGLTVHDAEAQQLAGVTLAVDEYCCLLRRDHPLATVDEVKLADLEDDPFLLSTGGCEDHIRRMYDDADADFRPLHRIRQLTTLFSMVECGLGVSIVPGLARSMVGPGLALVPIAPGRRRRVTLEASPRAVGHRPAAALLEHERELRV